MAAKRKTIEAMPIFVSAALGLLYVVFFMQRIDIVLLAIFSLLLIRSLFGLLR